jgi:lysophospholipase L1-like esterase
MRSLRISAAILATAIPTAILCAQTPTEKKSTKDAGKKAGEAQEKKVDWEALFKIHYDNRVRSFREQNLVFQNVVLLGDSITEAFEPTQFFPGRRVLNRGIGADVIGHGLPSDDRRGVLRRLDSSVYQCAATDVFLMIGVNDLNANRNLDVMEAGYREILQQIRDRAPAVRVHVQSLLPTRGVFAKHNEPIKQFNGRIKQLAEEFGYKYLDLHPLFVDKQGELKAEYTADGLHLTEPAYEIWRAEIEKAMGWRPRGK